MATTTTNFNFPIPQSTDLVKDGATAIAALGTSVDTQFVDLKGGTTGQVLAKASNTDLDYSWTTPQVGDITGVTAGTGISGGGTSGDVTITNSMATAMTTKGDLVPATGSGAFARLAVGANNLYLVADSSAATGLKYEGAITSWTPTFTNLTVGNGTTIAEYQRVGNLVFCYIQFTLGSTSAVSGDVFFTLPVATSKRPFFTGNAYYVDAGVQTAGGSIEVTAGGSHGYFRLSLSDGTYLRVPFTLSSTTPWTWGTNDYMAAYFYYEVA